MHQPLVEIKEPCYEVLDKKKPGEAGNYCKSCRIVVTDFTGMKPEEISHYLANHKVHCGTFNRSDVSTGSFIQKAIAYLQSHRLRFAAIVLSSVILLVSCKVRRGKVQGNSGGWGNEKASSSIEHLK